MLHHKNKMQKVIESFFWILIISAIIITNFSLVTFLSKWNLLNLLIIIVSVLIIAFDRICSKKMSSKKRLYIELPAIVILISIMHFIYKYIPLEYILFFSPLILALSLSSLIVLDTRLVTIGLVSAICFLLGEAYWGGKIATTTILSVPIVFLRMFSLSLVVLFGYYLYRMKDEAVDNLERNNKQLEAMHKKLEELNDFFEKNLPN